MFDLDKWQEIFHSLRKHKLRTMLTAFGIFWGIFMLVILLGAGNGLENGVMQNFDIAKNAVFVWTRQTSLPYNGYQPGRGIPLTNRDTEAIRQLVSEVKVIAPRGQLGGFNTSRGKKNAVFSINGDYPEYLAIKPLLIESGRFLNDLDILEKRKVAVIGKRVKEILFEEGEEAVGQFIRIGSTFFRVVGVFSVRGRGDDAMEDMQVVHIPGTTLQRVFNRPDEVGWYGFIPKKGVPSEVVEAKVKEVLAKRHNVSPEDRMAFGSANIEQEFKEVQGLFIGIRAFSWLVAIGTILAGLVGVGNIMTIIVKERTKEIGIRKAVGATPWSIISMILLESVVLTAMAGYLGLMAGIGTVEGINYLLVEFQFQSEYFSNPQIDLNIATYAILVLVIGGTIAGLIPGTRASRLHPVSALQEE